MNSSTKIDLTPYRSLYDTEFRQQLRQHDPDALAEIGYVKLDIGEPPEIKVVTSTRDTIYLAMPGDISTLQLSSRQLGAIQAAGCAGSMSTVGSVGCASTISCATGTMSSFACLSSAGSAGSAGSADV